MIVRVNVVLNRTVGLLKKLKLIAESPHKTPSSTLVVKGFKMIQKSKVRQTTLQHKATSFPGFSPTRPYGARERERPWLGLVTWSQNKINSEGGVLCLSFFLSGSFSPFMQ